MNPLNHPRAHQIPGNDVEKGIESKSVEITGSDDDAANTPRLASVNHYDARPAQLLKGKLARWNERVESLAGLEARGITRVLPEEKHVGGLRSYVQMIALWFSMNMAATNIITGLLGPLVFGLGWKDSVCIALFATGLSACGPSYTSTFGPVSGNRTMVRVRE